MGRQDSEISAISQVSQKKTDVDEGKLIETEKSETGGVSIIFFFFIKLTKLIYLFIIYLHK